MVDAESTSSYIRAGSPKTVTVVCNIKEVPLFHPPLVQGPEPTDTADHPEMLVLVVEDDSQLCDALTKWLKKRGFSIAVAGDCKSGINQAMSLRPHVILLDLKLPDASGFELLRVLRGHGLSTPVVVLTGSDSPSAGFELAEFDVAGVIEKPARPDQIAVALRTAAQSGIVFDPFRQIQNLLSESTSSACPVSLLTSLAEEMGDPRVSLVDFALLAPLMRAVRSSPSVFVDRLTHGGLESSRIRVASGEAVLGLLGVISRAPPDQNERLARTLDRRLRHQVHVLTHRRLSSWIRLSRLRHAMQEIVRTDEQVSQIAHRLGFVRGGQLSRDIRGLVGLSPRSIRLARRNWQQKV